MKTPSTRAEARALGVRHYFTGKPCSRGHVVLRHVTGTCIECGKRAVRAWELRNPNSVKERARRYYLNRPETAKARSRRSWRKKMGMPEPLRPQPTTCELCGRKPTYGQMHLDHDHTTGAFRGWLCGCCNRGIGMLGDNVDGVERAIAYLKRAAIAA